jgi:predicted phosphohydrolase
VPIELTWLLPDKILLSRWTGVVSEDDMRVLVEELTIIFDAATGLIHTVIELSDVSHISTEGIYLYIQSSISHHPHRGRICMVNPTFESEVLADMTNRVFQREMVRVVETREQARDFLLGHDTPPPNLDNCQTGMALTSSPPPD